ncbi:MAG: hypothetical protein V8Q76_12905 [Bacteroides intestinalis]
MDQEFVELLNRIKSQVREEMPRLNRLNREHFFSDLNEWAYEKYEEALLEEELEMQNYDE